MYFPLFVGVLCLSLFCCALLCVHSHFAIILMRKRKLVALLLLSYRCIVTLDVLLLFLSVPWVGLRSVIVVFPDHTHLLIFIFIRARSAHESLILTLYAQNPPLIVHTGESSRARGLNHGLSHRLYTE